MKPKVRHLESDEVANIQDLLAEDYRATSVFKELIQNAEDGGAKQLHFGWIDDWPDTGHPLLNQPVLIALNDGNFSKKDEKYITNMGTSPKATDVDAIGTFGLGIKSVFHFCDAFFIAASKNQEACDGKPLVQVITPLKGIPEVESWEFRTRAEKSILKKLDFWGSQCSRWFCVLIPLRTEENRPKTRQLLKSLPKIGDIFPDLPSSEMLCLTPLLRSLDKITFWGWEAKKRDPVQKWSMYFNPKDLQRSKFRRNQIIKSSRSPVSGTVKVTTSPSEELYQEFQYAGYELELSLDVFQEMKENIDWRTTMDLETSSDVPRKAEPHCAVLFADNIHAVNDNPTLQIERAVFLPLTKPEESSPCKGERQYRLILHGWYILNRGRTAISREGIDGDWNSRIDELGVLPLILPALSKFIEDSELGISEVNNLTQCLQESETFRRNAVDICSKYQWLKQITDQDSKWGQWKLLDSNSEYLVLPKPPNDFIGLPFAVFPNLRTVCTEKVLVFEEQPLLTAKTPSKWDNGSAAHSLLKNLGPLALENDKGMAYLVSFFKSLGSSQKQNLAPVYARSVMKLVKDIGIDKVRPNENIFCELLDQLPQKYRVSVNLSKDSLAKLVSILDGLELNQILLPNSFHNDKSHYWGNIKLSTAEIMLKSLADDTTVDIAEKNEAALAIIEKTEGGRENKQRQFGDLKLFCWNNFLDNDESNASWNQLHQQFSKNILFSDSGLEKSRFLEALRKAVDKISIYSLKGARDLKPLWILFEKEDRGFSKLDCISILSSHPDLKVPNDRKDLLDELLGSFKDINCDTKKAIRYLLHGDVEKFDNITTPLLIDSNSGNKDLRNRLAREALRYQPDKWAIVPPVLAEILNQWINQIQDQRLEDQLNVRRLDPNQLEGMLSQQADLNWVSELNLSSKDRLQFFDVVKNDYELLKRLPIHETVNGDIISINASNIFLISGNKFRVSSVTESLVTLIKHPDDDRAEYVYREKLIKEWTPHSVIQTAIRTPSPESWRDILTALGCLERKPDDNDYRQLIENCRTTPWIPTDFGLRAPRDLVKGKVGESSLITMLSPDGRTKPFYGAEHILQDCQEHQCYKKIAQLLGAKDEENLERIGVSLTKHEQYSIGNLSQRIEDPEFFENFLSVFTQCPPTIMPIVRIIKDLLDSAYQKDAIKKFILRPLSRPIEKVRLKQILNSCKTIHEQPNQSDKTKIMYIFNSYLAHYAQYYTGDLENIFFLNREGAWKLSTEIAADVYGIDPCDLLHESHAGVLEPAIKRNPWSAAWFKANKSQHELSDRDIQKYFEKFEGHVADRTIGTFLSIFCNKTLIEKKAKCYLGAEDLELFRARIDWLTMETNSNLLDSQRYETINKAMSQNTFKFYHSNIAAQPYHHYLPSIAGTNFQTREDRDNETIFVGNFAYECAAETGARIVHVILRRITPEFLEKINAQELLEKSALFFLKSVYCQQPKNLKDLFKPGQEEQLDLRVAQQLIVKHSMFYFRQLPSKYLTELQKFLYEWRNCEKLESQLKIFGSRGQEEREVDTASKQEQLLKELCDKLESDDDEHGIQRQLLEAVRNKIEEHYQYTPDSIPFELFQNADDASAELVQMKGGNLPKSPDIVHLSWDGRCIVFAHSGRSINFYKKEISRDRAMENAGYDSDLEKMLVMSYSDKGQRRDHVTGKFGLGFKSVFIVAERPKVLSGLLGFEVLAGMYPKRLRHEDRLRLKKTLEIKLGNPAGTVFEIGFDETLNYSPQEVNERFLKLLPFILVFSRQIKKCVLQNQQEPEKNLVHSEEPISNCPGAFVTRLRFPFNGGIGDCNALILRTEDFGALLLNLKTNGIGKFSETLPTFWNLAPLGKEGLGFAVNGNFLLDVGRAQIAEPIARHEEVSEEIGLALGEVLVRMHRASETDWPLLKQDLGLAADVTAQQMWKSFWKTLGSDLANENTGQNRERDLCQQIFWRRGRGMAKLFESKDAMPSGLYGDYEILTSLRKVRWCAEGRLDSDEKVFKIISSWGTFRSHIPAEGNDLVSKSRIKLPLENLMSKKFKWNYLNIEKVLKWELTNYPDVSPNQAEKLGTMITPQFLDTWDTRDGSAFQERELLVKNLKELRFKAASGAFVCCQHLLMSDHEDKEESLKAAFAPLEMLLDSNHGANAMAFFMACRGPIEISVDTMEQWALKPLNVTQQKAFLKYLIKGDQCQDLRPILLRPENTWFQYLTGTQAYRELKTYEQEELGLYISNTLESHREKFEEHSESALATPTVRIPRPDVLGKIYKWWQEERLEELKNYKQDVYPHGRFFDLREDSSSGQYNKKEWLKMFLLGCLQTLGLIGKRVSNRNFVEQNEHLISKLAHSEKEPSAWLQNFDDVIKHQINDFPFYQWHLQLFGLYIIGRHLTDYIDSVMKVNEFPGGYFSLRNILVSRTSEHYQHGGPNAPPINRVLGIGSHFLIRELYRNGILTHDGGHGLCYVPTSGVRKVIEELGCSNINDKISWEFKNEERSKVIFHFLRDHLDGDAATFEKDFDIPFQIISENNDLQEKFFHKVL